MRVSEFLPLRGESEVTVCAHVYHNVESVHVFVGERGCMLSPNHTLTNKAHSLFTDTEKMSLI